MLRRASLALACLATPAAAVAHDCPTAAFLIDHTRSLDELSLELDRQGRIDPSINGHNDFLRGADECELDRDRWSGGRYFTLECQWNLTNPGDGFGANSGAALRRFTDWSGRLQRCFEGQLTMAENRYTSPDGTYRVLFELEGEWEETLATGERSATLRLALIETEYANSGLRQFVSFEVERSD